MTVYYRNSQCQGSRALSIATCPSSTASIRQMMRTAAYSCCCTGPAPTRRRSCRLLTRSIRGRRLLGVRGRAVEEGCRDGSAAHALLFRQADIIAERKPLLPSRGCRKRLRPRPGADRLYRLFQRRQSHQRHALTASAFDPAGRAFALHAGPDDRPVADMSMRRC